MRSPITNIEIQVVQDMKRGDGQTDLHFMNLVKRTYNKKIRDYEYGIWGFYGSEDQDCDYRNARCHNPEDCNAKFWSVNGINPSVVTGHWLHDWCSIPVKGSWPLTSISCWSSECMQITKLLLPKSVVFGHWNTTQQVVCGNNCLSRTEVKHRSPKIYGNFSGICVSRVD